jgi:cytochrome P450
MFLAGTKTVQNTTANILMYLQIYPKVLAKLQKEVDTKLEPIKDDLVNSMTYEMG